jgi:phospholipid transport system substrate-binding protein
MTMTRITTFLAVLIWTAVLFSGPVGVSQARAEDTTQTPEAQFVQKMGDKALVQLTDKALPRPAREQRARQILRDHFDVPTIARFALGPYWRDATDVEKKEYMGLFEEMIVQTYTTRFEDYSGQSFKVDGAREEDERNYIVSSKILQNGGPPVDVEWHIRKKDGGLKVVDVIVENISMSVTQRDDFASVIQGGGGKMSALLESLRARSKKVAASRK